MNVLGIETSCDETSAAVVTDGRLVRSNVVFSQIAQHEPYGGVVPEVASRAHVERLPGLLREALAEAQCGWDDLDAFAVTCGPGLASSLLVGVVAAKALALRTGRPLIAVNHLEGHLYSIFLNDDFPADLRDRTGVVLLVSGGHTSLVLVEGLARRRVVGQTLDDAAGEALDKGAKLLGLGYPGGPAVERAAAGGNAKAVEFPRRLGPGFDTPVGDGFVRELCFSYSGLKTSLLYFLRDHPEARTPGALADVAASYQEAVVDALIDRLDRAAGRFRPAYLGCAGGVARNRRLRERLQALAAARGLPLVLARPELCTDNAAMIAAAAGGGLGRRLASPAELDIHPSMPLGTA